MADSESDGEARAFWEDHLFEEDEGDLGFRQ